MLGQAHALAQSAQKKAGAIIIGARDPSDPGQPRTEPIPIEMAAEQCRECGADTVYLAEYVAAEPVLPHVCGQILIHAIEQHPPMLLLFALTDLGRELAGRLSGAFDAGVIAKCLDIRIVDHKIVATCPSGEGKYLAEIEFVESGSALKLATVVTATLPEPRRTSSTSAPVQIDLKALQLEDRIKFVSHERDRALHQQLENAEIVVAGGAGLGDAQGFALARELAAMLGGELGATRPPVLQHWTEEERLIGQTGKSVQPNLLFSIGTSGATQYTSGISQAKTVIAINRDPHAPIFNYADVGIVADAKQFLTTLLAKLKQTLMRDVADTIRHSDTNDRQRGVGAKIKQLRQTKQWTLETLAQATGKSPEFIQQVEADAMTPSVAFLLSLARVFDLAPDAFLHQQQKEQLSDERTKAYLTRTQNYSYQTLTPEAKGEHLQAFMVEIEPKQAHKPVAYKHEGEEFILVEEGDLELTLGEKTHLLKPGESIHFNAETPHKLKSRSNTKTRCVVVLYTP